MKLDSICLVDDDIASNYNNKLLLKKLDASCEVIVKKNGKEALSHLEEVCSYAQDQTSLILLDLMMPVLDGFEFLRRFEHLDALKKKNIKIAVLTQYDSYFNIAKLKRMGEYLVISKPLTEEKFKDMMKSFEELPQ